MRANSRIWIPGGEGEENCNLLEIHTFRLVRSGNGLLPPRALLVIFIPVVLGIRRLCSRTSEKIHGSVLHNGGMSN